MSDPSFGGVNSPVPVRVSTPADRLSTADADRQTSPLNGPKLAWLLSVIVLSIVLRWRISSIPLERDEGEYAYVAQRWLAGDVPYRDAFDQKPPGIFLAYAALFATGVRSVEAIHWLGHASLVGTLVFVYMIGRRLWSHVIGCLAALFSVVLVMDCSVLGNASNTELFAILPLSAGMFFSLRAADSGRRLDAFLAGVSGGLAMCFKQQSLPIFAAQLMWVLFARSGRPSTADRDFAPDRTARTHDADSLPIMAGAVFGGVAMVLLPTFAYFVAHGAWSAFYDCVIGHNLAYSSRIPLWAYGVNLQYGAIRVLKSQWPLCVAMLVALGYLPLLLRAYKRWSEPTGEPRVTPGFLSQSGGLALCLWWWLWSFAAVSVGGFYREHYFILMMPPSALLAASGFDVAAKVLERRRIDWQGPIAVTLGLAAIAWPLITNRDYYLALDPQQESRRLYHTNPFVESVALGKALRDHSTPGDRIFILGSEPQILFYAERVSASRYIYVYPLFAPDRDAAARQQSVLDELLANPPKFVANVRVPSSKLAGPGSPKILSDGLAQLTTERYKAFADAVVAPDGKFRIVFAEYSPIQDRQLAQSEYLTIAVWERRD